jgi:hypothetical protein
MCALGSLATWARAQKGTIQWPLDVRNLSLSGSHPCFKALDRRVLLWVAIAPFDPRLVPSKLNPSNGPGAPSRTIQSTRRSPSIVYCESLLLFLVGRTGTPALDETSCDARPDHPSGSPRRMPPARLVASMTPESFVWCCHRNQRRRALWVQDRPLEPSDQNDRSPLPISATRCTSFAERLPIGQLGKVSRWDGRLCG